MHRVGIAGHQRMPPRQVLAVRQAAIRAGRRQPVDRAHFRRCQGHAIGHAAVAMRVIAALAGFQVQQAARDIGERQRAGVVVAQLVQATAAAAVAERFPLVVGHLLQRSWPSRTARAHPWPGRLPKPVISDQWCRLAAPIDVSRLFLGCDPASAQGRRTSGRPADCGLLIPVRRKGRRTSGAGH